MAQKRYNAKNVFVAAASLILLLPKGSAQREAQYIVILGKKKEWSYTNNDFKYLKQ